MHARNMRVHVGMHRDTRTHVQTHMRSYAHALGCKKPLKHSAAYGTRARTHMHARNVRVHTLIHTDTQKHTHMPVHTPMSSYTHVRGRKQPLKPLGA
jgi:hypothetical protein